MKKTVLEVKLKPRVKPLYVLACGGRTIWEIAGEVSAQSAPTISVIFMGDSRVCCRDDKGARD